MNLLQETLDALEENGKTPADVRYVGRASISAKCSWEDFAKQSDFEYDNGYGGAEISTDLVAVGDNWWLERAEYDGSEWWEFKTFPEEPKWDSHAFSRDLGIGATGRLRITHEHISDYYELLETLCEDEFKAKGIFKQKGAGSLMRDLYVREEEIKASTPLDLIGVKCEFATSIKNNDEAFSEEFTGEIRTVSFFDGNVVKLTVEVLAEIK